MKRKIFTALLLLLIFQLLSCVAIYHSVRDKRDRSYREGVELYNKYKFADAYDKFETVVDIEPEYKDAKSYLKKTKRLMALKVQKIKRKANVNYVKGVSLMHSGRYDDALGLLILAQEQDPDHVDVDEKIDECREKLVPKFNNLIKQAELQFKRKQYIPAYQTCLKAKTYNPSSGQLSSIKGKIEDKLEDKAEKYVDKGKQYYSKKQYTAAQAQLQLALRAYPWDKDTKELLDKISGKLNLDKNYQRGVTLYNSANYFGARAAFSQVNAVEPGYKATEGYLSKIGTALQGQVGVFYNSGVSYYDKGNYEAAIGEFNKVLSINPAHSNAQEYRQRAQTKLDLQKSIGGGGESE